MKRLLVTCVCLMSAYAYGETTLRIPIFLDGVPSASKAKQNKKNQTRKVPAKWFNSTLKKNGLKPLPTEMEFTADDKFSMSKIVEQVGYIAQELGSPYKDLDPMTETFPNENRAGDIQTCYTGRADGVWNVVSSLAGYYYTEQMGLWGWKYKDKTVINDDQDVEQVKELIKDNKVWKNWKGKDDAVLILTHIGDDGDDIEVSIIDRCDD